MQELIQYIKTHGEALDQNVLKVDAFLNHQIEPVLMDHIGQAFMQHFKNHKITKVVTIETSGIAPAVFTALHFNVPLVFLKKNVSRIHNQHLYHTTVHSYTKDIDYELSCNHKYLSADDSILFIDDFLANGEACLGAIDIIRQSGASLSGIGIVIEKSFQPGRDILTKKGYEPYSLARIASLDKGQITFL